jgi:hypothetical protein
MKVSYLSFVHVGVQTLKANSSQNRGKGRVTYARGRLASFTNPLTQTPRGSLFQPERSAIFLLSRHTGPFDPDSAFPQPPMSTRIIH